MSGTISDKLEARHALACPYCRAGMYWDFQDGYWICSLCGYRENDDTLLLRSTTQIVAARVWNKIFNHPDDEKNGNKSRN